LSIEKNIYHFPLTIYYFLMDGGSYASTEKNEEEWR